MIVVDVLRAIVKDQKGNWIVRMRDDKPAISKQFYSSQSLTKKGPAHNGPFQHYPAVFEYKGGYLPLLDVLAFDGRLSTAIASLSRLRTVAGSDDSTLMLLSGMRGMSGYSSDFGKRIQFLLSASLHLWTLGKKVDIRLTTIGDLPVLLSSLNSWLKDMQEKLKFTGDDWFRFLPPTRSPLALPEATKIYFISAHRKDAVAVWYCSDSIPTNAEKKVPVDYDAVSFDLVPGDVDVDFVAFSPIYGAAPFREDDSVTAELKKRSKGLGRRFYTFEFGTASKFRGVISSFKDVSLLGYGWEKDSKGTYDMVRTASFVKVPLPLVLLQADWYNKVCNHVMGVYSFLFGVVRRYSPISSLISVTKKTIQLNLSMAQADGDLYVAPVLEKKRTELGSKFVPDDEILVPLDEEDEGVLTALSSDLPPSVTLSTQSKVSSNFQISLPNKFFSDDDDGGTVSVSNTQSSNSSSNSSSNAQYASQDDM